MALWTGMPPYDPQTSRLLLQRSWWKARLQGLPAEPEAPLVTPRPDLSSDERTVVEFQIRAHDGARLWGLYARPSASSGPVCTRIRNCGPADLPEIDESTLRHDQAEFVMQEPAGRRLADRVLDVINLYQVAKNTPGIDRTEVSLGADNGGTFPDEFLIVRQLSDWNMC
jgi:hypothetical protein